MDRRRLGRLVLAGIRDQELNLLVIVRLPDDQLATVGARPDQVARFGAKILEDLHLRLARFVLPRLLLHLQDQWLASGRCFASFPSSANIAVASVTRRDRFEPRLGEARCDLEQIEPVVGDRRCGLLHHAAGAIATGDRHDIVLFIGLLRAPIDEAANHDHVVDSHDDFRVRPTESERRRVEGSLQREIVDDLHHRGADLVLHPTVDPLTADGDRHAM